MSFPSLADNISEDFNTLEELNSFNVKPILPIKDMELYNAYKILNCKKTQTKYGEKLRLNLEDYYLFLPERYNGLSLKTIEKINEGGYFISYQGSIGNLAKFQFSKSIQNPDFYINL